MQQISVSVNKHLAPRAKMMNTLQLPRNTEFDSTTVVLPGYTAEMDEFYNILINPKA